MEGLQGNNNNSNALRAFSHGLVSKCRYGCQEASEILNLLEESVFKPAMTKSATLSPDLAVNKN